MGELTDKPEEIGTDARSPVVRDRVDLGHELAGLETGRIRRFLADGASGYATDTDEKKARREYRSLLHMLLAEDPHYAALYTEVSEKIIHASRAVDQALIDINQRLEAADGELRVLADAAARLDDGTKVFRSKTDGSIYTEDGTRLSDDQAQNIHIPDGSPSWEDYQEKKDRYETAQRHKDEVETYQRDVLRPAEQRLNDADNPPTMDELERLEDQIDGQMPQAVKDKLHVAEFEAEPMHSTSTSAAHDIVEPTDLTVPNLGKTFDLARIDVPGIDGMQPDTPAPAKTLG